MNLAESYITECFIKGRDGESLFLVTPDLQVLARLKGYAVVPIEEYESLTQQQLQEEMLSKEINLKSWGELARVVREKARRLASVADAFERYQQCGEPFIGQRKDSPKERSVAV